MGRYARERYTNEFNLLNPQFTPGEVYVQSTDVNRTIQSGYSELMGLYPAGNGPKISQAQADNLATGKGMPPIKIRNAAVVNMELGQNPLPNGFVSVPIFAYLNVDINDQLSMDACPYVYDTVLGRYWDNGLFDDFWWVANFAKKPLADALEVDYETMAKAEFIDMSNYADAYVCQEFEGIPFAADTFDDNTYHEMLVINKIELAYKFT